MFFVEDFDLLPETAGASLEGNFKTRLEGGGVFSFCFFLSVSSFSLIASADIVGRARSQTGAAVPEGSVPLPLHATGP